MTDAAKPTAAVLKKSVAAIMCVVLIVTGGFYPGTVRAAETAEETAEESSEEMTEESSEGISEETAEEMPKAPSSTILAAKYYTNCNGTQWVDWYLICDPYDNLYISRGLKYKIFICNFPNAMKYKFGVRKNGDILAVYRSELSKAVTEEYGPELDDVRKNPRVLLCSERYRVIHEVPFGDYHPDTGEGLKPSGWLENCGFCSLPNGDVVFVEYTRMGVVFTANCWRIEAGSDLTDADSWKVVKQFQVAKNDDEDYDESVIEHFHTAQMDPYTGIVYIATGDYKNKAQMWYSRDNGRTWEQQTFTDPYTGNTLTSSEKYFRILNYNFTEDAVYWSSDSSKNHAIFKCSRAESGELDPDSIEVLVELDMIEGHPATYGTVYYPEYNLMVLMERCDWTAESMLFRVYDLDDDSVKEIDTIYVAGDEPRNVGFRTEYTEFIPTDGKIKVGFGNNVRYRNYNDLCGNPGDSDWTNNINNLWIEVYRDEDGEITVDYGYYEI